VTYVMGILGDCD